MIGKGKAGTQCDAILVLVMFLQQDLAEEADAVVLGLGSDVLSVEQALHLAHHHPLHCGVELQQLRQLVQSLQKTYLNMFQDKQYCALTSQ